MPSFDYRYLCRNLLKKTYLFSYASGGSLFENGSRKLFGCRLLFFQPRRGREKRRRLTR